MSEVTVIYGLYTEDGEGSYDLQAYAGTREEAISWFKDRLVDYPNNKVQVREITFKVIVDCALTPIFLD